MDLDHHPDARRWNQRYAGAAPAPTAARVLVDNLHLLPPPGSALDLACGLGANALLLARQGLATTAWDISRVAIAQLDSAAGQHGLRLNTEVRDVTTAPPPPSSFDVIVVSHFLHRPLAPALVAALRPGGLLYYQTFGPITAGGAGPTNPAYRLTDNELLHLFAPLRMRVYREEGVSGDLNQGLRGEVLYVGQRF